MKTRRNVTTNIAAASAVIVTLSGFLPNPSRPVYAATATISASGSFTGGVTLTAGANLFFGKMVATNASGLLDIATSGVTAVIGGFFNTVGATNGTIKFNAGALKAIDMTIVGPANSIPLGSTANGGKTGIVNLERVTVGGPFTSKAQFNTGALKATRTLTSLTVDMNIGGRVSWGAVQPLGTFTQAISLTVSY